MKRRNDPSPKPSASNLASNRRRLLLAAGAGAASLALPRAVRSAHAATTDAPSVAAAKAEGPVVVWHGDQEPDVVEFLKQFTQKTGVPAVQQRLLPGAALPKLEIEFRTGQTSGDLYMTSDVGIMEQLRKQNHLLRYVPKEIDAYGPEYHSAEPGYWTAYFINVGPMMYDPRHVNEAEAPKSWMDLLNPMWKNQIGFQNSSAGTSYALWYVLKDILPRDYWDELAKQKPRAYSSSTQILQDIERDGIKIGGRVSIFQYVKSVRNKQPANAVFPAEGVPSANQVAGIFSTAKHPNGAKIFIDYLTSKEGQYNWNNIQGSYSPRKDVHIEHLPDIDTLKLLLPRDLEDFQKPEHRREFVAIWNKMTGL